MLEVITMLIGVASDTHGKLDSTLRAVKMFESLEVELVIHCGDIGSPAVVGLFQPWPTHFVFGNVDDQRPLEDAIRRAGQTSHGRFGSLELEGRRIAFLHGDDSTRFRQTITSGAWDLVCYGHTHAADLVRQGTTLVLNPGALSRASQHTVAVVRLPTLDVQTITV